MKTYLFTYQYDGSEWILELKATSPADARARIARLPYARFDGELFAKIPVVPHVLMRIWGTIKSLAKSNAISVK